MLKTGIRNAWFNGLATVSQLVIGLLFAGYTIRLLGNERAGYWLALQSVVAVSATLGAFGLGTAALRRMAVFLQKEDYQSAQTSLATVLSTNFITGLMVSSLFWVFTDQLVAWSQINAAYRGDAATATRLVGAIFLVNQVSSAYAITYSAAQRYDLVALISTAFGLLSGGLGILILTRSPHISSLGLLGLSLAVTQLAINTILTSRVLRRFVLPEGRLGFLVSEVKQMSGFGIWAYFGSLGSLLILQADRILITTLLGSAALPFYAFPQRIMQMVHGSMTGQASFLFPQLSGEGERRSPHLYKIIDKLVWLVASASILMYGILILIGMPLMAVLVSPEFALQARWPFYLAMVQGIFWALTVVPYYISWALGDARANTTVANVQGIVVLGSMWVLIPMYGVLGASVSQLWIIPFSIVHVLWVRLLTKRYLGPTIQSAGGFSPYVGPGIMALIFTLSAILYDFDPVQLVGRSLIQLILPITLALAAWFLIEKFVFLRAQRLDLLVAVGRLVAQRINTRSGYRSGD